MYEISAIQLTAKCVTGFLEYVQEVSEINIQLKFSKRRTVFVVMYNGRRFHHLFHNLHSCFTVCFKFRVKSIKCLIPFSSEILLPYAV